MALTTGPDDDDLTRCPIRRKDPNVLDLHDEHADPVVTGVIPGADGSG